MTPGGFCVPRLLAIPVRRYLVIQEMNRIVLAVVFQQRKIGVRLEQHDDVGTAKAKITKLIAFTDRLADQSLPRN